MLQAQVQPKEFKGAKRQIALGLAASFSIYAVSFYYLQTMGVARPRMAAELNGMPMFSWLISIPGVSRSRCDANFQQVLRHLWTPLDTNSISEPLVGTLLSAVSPTFVSLIIANAITSLGLRALIPLASRCWEICLLQLNAVNGSGCLTFQPEFFPYVGQR